MLDRPAPTVWIERLGDSAVILQVAAWIAQHETDFMGARGEAYRMCLVAFDAAGIGMPGPICTIRRAAGPGDTVPARDSASTPVRTPVHAPGHLAAQDVGALANQQLERIISQEREAQSGSDLLNRKAPEE